MNVYALMVNLGDGYETDYALFGIYSSLDNAIDASVVVGRDDYYIVERTLDAVTLIEE